MWASPAWNFFLMHAQFDRRADGTHMLNILGMLMKCYWDNENPHFDFKTGIFQLYYLKDKSVCSSRGRVSKPA